MKQRDIFKFWLPLLGSWLLLTLEGPTITIVVNRLPEAKTMLAAAGIVISLSVFIESPVINLLATSTAKVNDFASYRVVRRFSIQWAIGLTLVHLLFGYTKLFDWIVIQGMGVPDEIATHVRAGMQIMILWSAAIAWRRFLQGVLIRFERPQTVAIGTAIRLVSAILVAVGLAVFTDLSGIVVAAWTWMTGVVTEAIYATYAVRPLFEDELQPGKLDGAGLSSAELFTFHLPLAATSFLTLLVQPLAVFSLARLPESETTLAAWPVLFQVLLVARAPALAIPETIIALNRSKESAAALRRFILMMAVATLIGTVLFVVTPLGNFYLNRVQSVPVDVAPVVMRGMVFCLLFPAITAIVFSTRGFLISNQTTRPVNVGMMINVTITAIILLVGVTLQIDGIVVAAIALNVAIVIEMFYLNRQNPTPLFLRKSQLPSSAD